MIDFDGISNRMEKAVDSLRGEFATMQAGRANPSLLDNIQIDAYGTKTPLAQLGTINVPEPRLITIQVWDKAQTPLIEKAIVKADLGINPVVDGQIIRLPIPQLSEERRKEIVKLARKAAEQTKISLRNIRRDGMDELKALEKEIGKDEVHNGQTKIQALIDNFTKKIDAMFLEKEKDTMQI